MYKLSRRTNINVQNNQDKQKRSSHYLLTPLSHHRDAIASKDVPVGTSWETPKRKMHLWSSITNGEEKHCNKMKIKIMCQVSEYLTLRLLMAQDYISITRVNVWLWMDPIPINGINKHLQCKRTRLRLKPDHCQGNLQSKSEFILNYISCKKICIQNR